MTGPGDWRRRRTNDAGGPIDEAPRSSARPTSGAGAGGAPPALIITRQVPEEAPPPGSQFFAPDGEAAVVGAGIFSGVLASVQVQADYYAVLKSVDFFVAPWTAVSDVRFAVRINGGPASGLDAVGFFPAALALVSRGVDLSLPVPRGALVEIVALDVDGAAYLVGASFFGWQWPVAIDQRYRPEGTGVR